MLVSGHLTLTGRLSRIHDKQNNSYWTARNYEILSFLYSEIIITTFWYHVQPLATVAQSVEHSSCICVTRVRIRRSEVVFFFVFFKFIFCLSRIRDNRPVSLSQIRDNRPVRVKSNETSSMMESHQQSLPAAGRIAVWFHHTACFNAY